jgi:hypothetical protein
MVASKHKWKLSAKDQAGNDISDQVSNEFRGFIEATRLDQIAPWHDQSIPNRSGGRGSRKGRADGSKTSDPE